MWAGKRHWVRIDYSILSTDNPTHLDWVAIGDKPNPGYNPGDVVTSMSAASKDYFAQHLSIILCSRPPSIALALMPKDGACATRLYSIKSICNTWK
jgi:hypothetical protein